MRWLVTIFALLVWMPAAAHESTTCPADYAGHLPPRVTPGEYARTLTQLNIRPQPSTDVARLGALPAGVTIEIQGEPQCSGGYVWWQTDYDGVPGWIAEGSLSNDEYFLEPRGSLIRVEGTDGVTRHYVRTENGFIEHEACLRPPDDYERRQQGFAVLNARTFAMLDNAQRIYESMGRDKVNFRQSITQGSYNAGGVAASFGTHDGGGAVDLSVRSVLDFTIMSDEIEPMIEALRIAGFAAWLRATGDLYPNSPIHIHAIAIGDAEASKVAKSQVTGEIGYLRGYDAWPRENEPPVEDRHGGPVLCAWMIEDGFTDLREDAEALYAQGLTYHEAGRMALAWQNLSRAIELSDDARYRLARAQVYDDLGLFDDSREDYMQYGALTKDTGD